MLGTGKIHVQFKSTTGLPSLRCMTIETYGTKLAFGDDNGDLIKHDDKILQVDLDQVLTIKAK